MSDEKLSSLKDDPAFRSEIEANLGIDPVRVAMDKKLSYPSLVATQVKYLVRAKKKLPSYFEARCIIPPLAFEQSSSEAAAHSKIFEGDLCIDLTCGLGVDTFAFSKRFKKVISLEKDRVLADITRYNLKLLGADNVEIVNTTAEEFIVSNPELKADMIYADPARRDNQGKKVVVLSECNPDILALLPLLKSMSRKQVFKLSPLFDVKEAFRLFGPYVVVEVLSVSGECKEIVVEVDRSINEPIIRANIMGWGNVEYSWSAIDVPGAEIVMPEKVDHLVVPDVSLSKANISAAYFSDRNCFIEDMHGFAYSLGFPGNGIAGKVYNIEKTWPYKPKSLRKELKNLAITRATIFKRSFTESVSKICTDLGITEGGDTLLAFTTYKNERTVMLLKEAKG